MLSGVAASRSIIARFSNLVLFIDRELHAHALLDGEVVCFDEEARPSLKSCCSVAAIRLSSLRLVHFGR
jgi:hypothetical protein